MNIPELCSKLDEHGYIADERLGRQIKGALAVKPIAGAFLFGRAGTGKTFLPESLAKVFDAETFFYQCFPQTREEDLLYKLLPSESTISGINMVDGVIPQAIESSHRHLTFLILDEWDKTRPSADSFLLDFLQHGRINYNGRQLNALADNLKVWVTMNDERDLSEPLMRRLPKIDFRPLLPSLVFRALERSHPKHNLINACVILYVKAVLADLEKPATIQELRQLLDAATELGELADWGELVYQFVSKTYDNHKRISDVYIDEKAYQSKFGQSITTMDLGAYNATVTFEKQKTEWEPKIPLKVSPIEPLAPLNPDEACGLIPLSQTTYDAMLDIAEPDDNPAMFGDWAIVSKKAIELSKPIPLRMLHKAEKFWGQDGEIMFSEPLATRDNVMFLRKHTDIKMYKVTRNEVCGKIEGVLWVRWTKASGAEIIVNLRRKDAFEEIFLPWATSSERPDIKGLQHWSGCSVIAKKRWVSKINTKLNPRYGAKYSYHAGRKNTVSWTVLLGGVDDSGATVIVGVNLSMQGPTVFLGQAFNGQAAINFNVSAENYAEAHRIANAFLAEECYDICKNYRKNRQIRNIQEVELSSKRRKK